MAVMASYVDASGSPSELVVAPAAMVSTHAKWLGLEEDWNACLALYEVTALHMKHFAFSRGEFKGWDKDEPKRVRFLSDLMGIIETYIEFTATEAVYIGAFKKYDTQFELSELGRPYTLGCFAIAGRVFRWGNDQGLSHDDFIWLFEKGDEDQNDLRASWDKAYPDALVELLFLKKNDRYPNPEVCKRQRPFEAADLVAYENLKVHKLLDERADIPVFEDELRKPLQRMKAWPGALEWGFFGEEGIARICEKYRIPKRPG
jgi:hypothetical protein